MRVWFDRYSMTWNRSSRRGHASNAISLICKLEEAKATNTNIPAVLRSRVQTWNRSSRREHASNVISGHTRRIPELEQFVAVAKVNPDEVHISHPESGRLVPTKFTSAIQAAKPGCQTAGVPD